MAYMSNMNEARKLAQANANWFKKPYVVFFDTSGNIQVERIGPGPFVLSGVIDTFYPIEEKSAEAPVEATAKLFIVYDDDSRSVVGHANNYCDAVNLSNCLPGTRILSADLGTSVKYLSDEDEEE